MTDKPPPQADYDALAKQYLDLWQEQVAKMARDPGQLGQAAQAWSQIAQSMMPPLTPSAASKPQPGSAHDARSAAAPPTGATAPGPAHGNGGVDLTELLRRIDRLEGRVAQLEAERTAKPAAPARRKKPG